jgi:hypothetical protein
VGWWWVPGAWPSPVGRSAAVGSAALESLAEQVQQAAHALLAPGRYLVAVKERALLGEDQSGAIALGLELGCGDGDRDTDPV